MVSHHGERLLQVIEARIAPDLNSGCWLWTGDLGGSGYGEFMTVGRRRLSAHRLAYEIWNGPIPAGLHIDHKCRTRSCCNPTHLRAVTPRMNATENSGSVSALNRAKTQCVAGHPLSGSNLTPNTSYRECRICRDRRQAKWKAGRS